MRRALLVGLCMAALYPSAALGQRRALLLQSRDVPRALRNAVASVVSSRASLVSTRRYYRMAGSRGLRPTSSRTIRALGPRQHADVILSVHYARRGSGRVLRVSYFNGRTGELASSSGFRLRGRQLLAANQHMILQRMAAAARRSGGVRAVAPAEVAMPGQRVAEARVVERRRDYEVVEIRGTRHRRRARTEGRHARGRHPAQERPAPEHGGHRRAPSHEEHGHHTSEHTEAHGASREHEDDYEHGLDDGGDGIDDLQQWGFLLAASIGLGRRDISFPDGMTTRSTSPFFPAAQLEMGGYFRPDPAARLLVNLAARWTPSIFIELDDNAGNKTGAGSHHLTFSVGGYIPLSEGRNHVALSVEAGWNFRIFHQDVEIFFPDVLLSGPYAKLGAFALPFDIPVSIGALFEIGHMTSFNREFTELALIEGGVQIGGEAHVLWDVSREFNLGVVYRQAHVIMVSEHGGDFQDVEQYALIRATYSF